MTKPDKFPSFMCKEENEILCDGKSGDMKGYVFNGREGSQMVIWHCPEGGASNRHVHDYDEYCVVVSGTYTGVSEDGTETVYGPGDECFIPAGEYHQGYYSKNYRAIDAFEKERVKLKMQKGEEE
jgi:quercetin dioxygenase-like cupin family protein